MTSVSKMCRVNIQFAKKFVKIDKKNLHRSQGQ